MAVDGRPMPRVRIRLGGVDGVKLGARRFDWHDPYHFVLAISWPWFFAFAVTCYFVVNLAFVAAYMLRPDCVANARPGSFADHFFFSVETLSTVGYGVMSPATLYGHIVASMEILLGMIILALFTGLVFKRFSRPRARLMFSSVAVVAPFEGGESVMLRLVNERHQAIAEARARLTLLRPVRGPDQRVMRRLIDLELVRATTPMLALSWTLIHRVDKSSPLHGVCRQTLADEGAALIVSITGYDESISENIIARHTYGGDSILYGEDFVDIMSLGDDGEVILDMSRFHETRPIPLAAV